jgi:single-stranded-DNA-specific exonuclease
LKSFLAGDIEILLTCDTGISEVESIAYAQSHQIDCIITDHHKLPQTLPPAFAVIDPRMLATAHPLSSLPGVGTAYKFAEHLLAQFGAADFSTSLHDLVALGAVADLAELTGDTRYLVQSGLDLIRSKPRPALLAMLQAAEVEQENFSEEQVSFAIAPRMNAVGRLEDANPMVEFLLSNDPVEIAVRVNQLENLNARRKILCDQVFDGALAAIERDRSLLEQPALILAHPDWPGGVVGIVASRLVEMFHRPVILLVSPPGQPMKGSARSVEGIDITSAIAQNRRLLLGFGGHPMAAGLSLSADNFTAFKSGLMRSVALQASTSQVSEDLIIDAWMKPIDFSLDLLASIDSLAPFGPANPSLLFASNSMSLVNAIPVGKTGEHLQVTLEDPGGVQSKMIWWHGAGMPLSEGKFDLAYTAHSSNYRGEPQIQFEWVDFRQVKETSIDLSGIKNKDVTNHDLRRSKHPFEDISRISSDPQILIWSEGTFPQPISTMDRNHLQHASGLAIWCAPPDLIVLKRVIQEVKPRDIYWLLQSPAEHQLSDFLKSLSRIVKAGLGHGQVEFDLEQIALELALTSEIVHLGIKWLASEGHLTVQPLSDRLLRLERGGTQDVKDGQLLKNALRRSFEEVDSFTAYLRRVDLDLLLHELG